MALRSFEDALAWQRAMDLNVAVDKALSENKNWGFRDQLFRAALSICNNLAEGYEMPTTAHQLKYLWIAKGSCNEVCSMLILAKRRGYFPDDAIAQMLGLQDDVGRLIRTYINHKSKGWGKDPWGIGRIGVLVQPDHALVHEIEMRAESREQRDESRERRGESR